MTDYLDSWNIRNILYKLKDSEARTLITAIQSTLTNLQTQITNLSTSCTGKVSKSGDSMSGALEMSANIVMSSGKKLVLDRTASTAALEAGDNTVLLRSGADDNNWHGLRVRANSGSLEYTENVNGTGKNFPIEYSYFTTFSGTTLTAESRHEYAQSSAITGLTITWPAAGRGVIFGVNFTSGSSTWNGITHKNSGGTDITSSVKVCGSRTDIKGKRYNIICWYDGSAYWMAVKAA